MRKSWIILGALAIAVLLSLGFHQWSKNKYNLYIDDIQTSLYSEYKRAMTAKDASFHSMSDAYSYPGNKVEITKRYGLKYFAPICDLLFIANNPIQKNLNLMCYSASILMSLLAICTVLWFIYVFRTVFLLFKKKLNKEIVFYFFLLTILLSVGAGYFFHDDISKATHKKWSTVDTLDSSYWDSIWGLIQLSNYFYDIDKSMSQSTEANDAVFMSQFEYLKSKATDLKGNLGKLEYKKATQPVIEICNLIVKYADLWLESFNLNKSQFDGQKFAKSIAQYRIIEEKLSSYLWATKEDWGLFPEGLLNAFSEDAKAEYELIASHKSQVGHKQEFGFGYGLWDMVTHNLETKNDKAK